MIAMFDRGSLLRPSKKHPDWKIQAIPHFDINPWEWISGIENNPVKDWRPSNCYN